MLTLEPPPAPRWLAAQDRWEEAIRVLANLHGKGDIGHPNVLAQYREIEEVLRFEREEAVNAWRALTKPRMLNRVILGMSIQMWSQIVGINTMVSSMFVRFIRGNILIAATPDVLRSVRAKHLGGRILLTQVKLPDAVCRYRRPFAHRLDSIYPQRCSYASSDLLPRHMGASAHSLVGIYWTGYLSLPCWRAGGLIWQTKPPR